MGRGYPPPQPNRGSGERRKLHQRGRKRILVHFELEKKRIILVMTNLMSFSHLLGVIRPQAPSGYASDLRLSPFWGKFFVLILCT